MKKKLLLFGGAFNPPHKGHERLLYEAIKGINPDLTIVMPTSVSPHKESGDIGFFHRYNMTRLFIKEAGFSNIKVSGIENKGRKRRNYTIKTLRWLEKKYKGYEIYLLLGSDMLDSFTTWSRYRRILSVSTLVVASREQHDPLLVGAIETLKKDGARIEIVSFDPIVISSSRLREAIREGEDVKEYVSPAVIGYIQKQKIYKQENTDGC